MAPLVWEALAEAVGAMLERQLRVRQILAEAVEAEVLLEHPAGVAEVAGDVREPLFLLQLRPMLTLLARLVLPEQEAAVVASMALRAARERSTLEYFTDPKSFLFGPWSGHGGLFFVYTL